MPRFIRAVTRAAGWCALPLTHRFERALIYTCHMHGGQTRKKTTISLGGS